MSEHGFVATEDDDGWWWARCDSCGWAEGPLLGHSDALDAYLEHECGGSDDE